MEMQRLTEESLFADLMIVLALPLVRDYIFWEQFTLTFKITALSRRISHFRLVIFLTQRYPPGAICSVFTEPRVLGLLTTYARETV